MNVRKNILDFFNVLIYLDQPNSKRKAVYFIKNEEDLINCYILRQNDIIDVNTEKELLDSLLNEGIESCVLIENIKDNEMDKMLSVCFQKYSMIRVTKSDSHPQTDNFLFIADQVFNDLRIVCGKNVLTNEQYLNIKNLLCDTEKDYESDNNWDLMYKNNAKSYRELYEELYHEKLYSYSKIKILKPSDLSIKE